jgi:hypothetical protein
MRFGEPFAIAATKQIKPEQEAAADNPRLQRYLSRREGFECWRTLPRGCILGTVVLREAFEITREFIMELDEEEYVYGDWQPGRWAWRVSDPVVLPEPKPARGQQGVWDYHGPLAN